MDPISLAASALLAQVDWKKVLKGLATDSASNGAKSLLAHLKPTDRDKTAKDAIDLFVHEFLTELEDKTPLSSAIPGYKDQLKRLIEHAAPDITVWLQPETKDVDLGPVQRMWDGLGLTPLPEDFDWTLVSKELQSRHSQICKKRPISARDARYRAARTANGATAKIAGIARTHGRTRSRI